ncbi:MULTISPECIES: copper-binding protein [Sorangium]|uniref:Copper-binding protein n=1 Tax=Sorangium atrum TaxID=2995308 RepID=A0ABT5CH35_9BACT|nr:copper-binding protein [Sorangium aterium]MDC0685753.1 copper-binding protein [Sorangium aterium]
MSRSMCSRLGAVHLARSLLLGAAIATSLTVACSKASTAAPRVHHATGAVRSLGPGRAYVNIAHDDIPGYMSAMTMSFEPQGPSQLDGIEVGDRIAFDFYETEDARRVLTRVEKRR